MYGYGGKILVVDLAKGEAAEKPTDEELAKAFLGGVGFTTKLLFDYVDPHVDPLSPENVLIFGVGALVGTCVPTAARTEATAKSPITGLFGTSNSGRHFGLMLKLSGYDALVIRGASEKPVYLKIDSGGVEIRDAEGIWGLNTWEAIDAIKREVGGYEVACIGPAAENGVLYACIQNGKYDAWGRTGLGAVMGSKKLKAVAVRGDGEIEVADPEKLLEASLEARERILSHPATRFLKTYGILFASDLFYQEGSLPIKNFQGVEINWEKCLRDEILKYKTGDLACTNCPIACAKWIKVEEGKFAGLSTKSGEITSVLEWGAKCGLADLLAVAKAADMCHKLGMDWCSSAGAIAFAFELFQRGIISEEDTGGLKLEWGDEEAVYKMIEMIAYRKGLGNKLALGVKRAAEAIGKGSERYAMHIKGLEIGFRDPRGRWGVWCFGYLTNTRGGDSLRCRSPVELYKIYAPPEEFIKEGCGVSQKVIDRLDMPDEFKQLAFLEGGQYVSIPHMAVWSENLIALLNAVGICIRPAPLGVIGPKMVSKLYNAATGFNLSPQQMAEAGERIWNLQKVFNVLAGEKREDYRWPDRFYEEPLPAGPKAGRVLMREGVEAALKLYFECRGWDPSTSVPTKQKLQQLGLGYAYEKLRVAGKAVD